MGPLCWCCIKLLCLAIQNNYIYFNSISAVSFIPSLIKWYRLSILQVHFHCRFYPHSSNLGSVEYIVMATLLIALLL